MVSIPALSISGPMKTISCRRSPHLFSGPPKSRAIWTKKFRRWFEWKLKLTSRKEISSSGHHRRSVEAQNLPKSLSSKNRPAWDLMFDHLLAEQLWSLYLTRKVAHRAWWKPTWIPCFEGPGTWETSYSPGTLISESAASGLCLHDPALRCRLRDFQQ